MAFLCACARGPWSRPCGAQKCLCSANSRWPLLKRAIQLRQRAELQGWLLSAWAQCDPTSTLSHLLSSGWGLKHSPGLSDVVWAGAVNPTPPCRLPALHEPLSAPQRRCIPVPSSQPAPCTAHSQGLSSAARPIRAGPLGSLCWL